MSTFMRKKWRHLLATGLVVAMAITSLPFSGMETVKAADSRVVNVEDVTTAEVTVPDSPCSFQELSSEEIIEAAGLGWNLGNTLDAWTGNDFRTGETLWQPAVTTKAMIKKIHDLGFNTIRIPVTWGANITEDYEVLEEWMSRVQEVVDYAIAEDMFVVLNVHHDGCRNDAPTPHGWLDVAGTDEEFESVVEKFSGLWATIAERFKNYDEHLMFAAMNEVFDDVNGIGWAPEQAGVSDELMELLEIEMGRINVLNQEFVDAVRDSGGNNEMRWLVVQPHNTQIAAVLKEEYYNLFEMPSDPADSIMLEVHDYASFSFAQLNEEFEGTYAQEFAALKEQFVDSGVPVIIGEYGFTGGDTRSVSFEGLGYMLKKYSMIGVVWDNNGTNKGDAYKIFDRDNLEPYGPCIAGLMRGYYYNTDASQVVKGTEVIPMTSLEVSEDSVELMAGESATVTASATAPDNTNDTIVWTTSDNTVATVHDGVIRARAEGTAVITAKALTGEAKEEITVTVNPAELDFPSEEITLPSSDITLEVGQETYLDADVSPEDNDAELIYRSADEAVANVSCDGRVLAKGAGETTVTVLTSDGLKEEVKVSVPEPLPPSEYQMRLAVHILYNYKNEEADQSYYGTEYSSDAVTVRGDGTYTVKFDCASDLSKEAKEAGVTSLNGLGSLYIKDYDVTLGNQRKSPEGDGLVSYTSIKVNGTELLDAPTEGAKAMKGGVFDTGNPFNVWDGSVVSEDKLDVNKKLNMISFKDIDSPTVVEITFKMEGFYTAPTPTPSENAAATPSASAPAASAPAASAPVVSAPATGATIVPPVNTVTPSAVRKGDEVKASGSKYTVTDVDKKTVEYKAPTSKKKTSITIPAKITVDGTSYKVTSIAKNACKGNKKLAKVTIGSNVTKIGANAFSGCSKLKNVIVKSKKLKSIGKNAFKGIHKKAAFKVPKAKYRAYKKLLKSKVGYKKTMKLKKV